MYEIYGFSFFGIQTMAGLSSSYEHVSMSKTTPVLIFLSFWLCMKLLDETSYSHRRNRLSSY